MFLLKKFVSFWLMPLPFCLTLLVIGVSLLWSGKRTRLGRALVTIAALLLLVFSNKTISAALVRPLEAIYPAMPELLDAGNLPAALAKCRYVVVLGGGHGDTPGLSATSKLSTSARGRIVEGVRLMHALPDARLVTSGGGTSGQPTHALVMADAAASLRIARARIDRLETPRDTEEEAQAIRQLIGDAPFALVTSAWHMRRAMALMEKTGLHPVACPADYASRRGEVFHVTDLSWDSDSLTRSTWAVYERIGYAWARLRGKA